MNRDTRGGMSRPAGEPELDAGRGAGGHDHGHDHGAGGHGHGHDHGAVAPAAPTAPGHDAHDHGHGHAHSRIRDERRLLATLIIGVLYMGVEAVGGWWVGSLALMADAGHMLSDAAALGVTLLALRMARLPEDDRRTYGYHRAEVLAAVVNGAALIAIGVGVLIEAIVRMGQPVNVNAGPMMGIAAGGLLVNLVGLAILSGADRSGLNVRGAWLHLLSDSLGSAGAILAGLLVWWKGWEWADPLASALIALLVLRSAYTLLRECVGVLMETAPAHIQTEKLRAALLACPGVATVHDIHVWTITSGIVAMSGHVVAQPEYAHADVLRCTAKMLRDEFGIWHSTIQVEPEGYEEVALHR